MQLVGFSLMPVGLEGAFAWIIPYVSSKDKDTSANLLA